MWTVSRWKRASEAPGVVRELPWILIQPVAVTVCVGTVHDSSA